MNGPKPIILNRQYFDEENERIIRELLVEQNMDGLGSEQAIIVRNQEKKNDLPEVFKKMKGLVLTTEECKGLEYNDVIIWNFFDPSLTLKWRILKSLNCFPQRGKTKFNLRDFNISEHE